LSRISALDVRIPDGLLIFYKTSRASENPSEQTQKLARSRSRVPFGKEYDPEVPPTPGASHAFSVQVPRIQ